MVEYKTIDRVLSHLINEEPLKTTKELTKLGRELLKMNAEALNQRYGDDLKQYKKHIENYKFNYRIETPCQYLKSINCLLYQCSEGDVPNKKLFKWLKKIRQNLLFDIVNNLDDYKKAEWG